MISMKEKNLILQRLIFKKSYVVSILGTLI